MLLTMRERQDVRPVTLFYGSATSEEIIFREELAELAEAMPNLAVVHVIARPSADWRGESGPITADLLRRIFRRSSFATSTSCAARRP